MDRASQSRNRHERAVRCDVHGRRDKIAWEAGGYAPPRRSAPPGARLLRDARFLRKFQFSIFVSNGIGWVWMSPCYGSDVWQVILTVMSYLYVRSPFIGRACPCSDFESIHCACRMVRHALCQIIFRYIVCVYTRIYILWTSVTSVAVLTERFC